MARDNTITVHSNGVIVRSHNRRITIYKHPEPELQSFIMELVRVDGSSEKATVIQEIFKNKVKLTAFALSEESLDQIAMAWMAYKREQGHVFELNKDEQN